MKRVIAIFVMVIGMSAFAGNNPTNPNTSYKNNYPKGSKGSKEIREDQLDRNYKKQGTLKVKNAAKKNVTTGGAQNSYKHPFGL